MSDMAILQQWRNYFALRPLLFDPFVLTSLEDAPTLTAAQATAVMRYNHDGKRAIIAEANAAKPNDVSCIVYEPYLASIQVETVNDAIHVSVLFPKIIHRLL